MKKAYSTPRLVEFGELQNVTLGATGPQHDAVVTGGVPKADPNNPGCVNNVPSGYCYHFTS